MRDPWNDSELARRFAAHAEDSAARAPLYAALAGIISRDRSLSGLLAHAPLEQQLPVLLLASIHSLVLDEPDHHLADWYPNLRHEPLDPGDDRLAAVFTDFVHERSPAILQLLQSRTTQTNEIGRCALLLVGLALLGDEVGPLAHLDVGTSAGLNTFLPHYAYRYDDAVPFGGDGPLLTCDTRGDGPVPTSVPRIVASIGLDPNPIDVTDPDDARWLRACCWPDQTDRFERLSAAVAIASDDPPRIVRGDATDDLVRLVVEAAATAHPVLTSSWVMNYLTPADRRGVVDRLDEAGADLDLSWVFAESPALTPELPHLESAAAEHTTALSVVRWRDGERSVRHLALCHPHGYWLHWH